MSRRCFWRLPRRQWRSTIITTSSSYLTATFRLTTATTANRTISSRATNVISRPNNRQWIWETNFIPDARKAQIDAQEQKGAGVNLTQFEISNNTLIGHLAEWPVGRYHKAHFHGGGAVLVILRSEGYSLMWPNHLGTRPYENGFGDEVVRVDWVPGSVFSPPTNWFHQHFNTGAEPALQLALRCGSQKFPLGIRVAAIRAGVYTSVKQGGTLIEYEDEDPAIRAPMKPSSAKKGIAPDMNYDAAANDD